jgi:hypothetical protein
MPTGVFRPKKLVGFCHETDFLKSSHIRVGYANKPVVMQTSRSINWSYKRCSTCVCRFWYDSQKVCLVFQAFPKHAFVAFCLNIFRLHYILRCLPFWGWKWMLSFVETHLKSKKPSNMKYLSSCLYYKNCYAPRAMIMIIRYASICCAPYDRNYYGASKAKAMQLVGIFYSTGHCYYNCKLQP